MLLNSWTPIHIQIEIWSYRVNEIGKKQIDLFWMFYNKFLVSLR